MTKKKKQASCLPVAPHCKTCSKKHNQKCHVGDPHDDVHGVPAKESPRDGRGRGLGLGAAHDGAILAAAGPRDLIHRFVAGFGGISHGLHAVDGEIYRVKVCCMKISMENTKDSVLNHI